jgi:hypothetical protein
MEVEMNIPKDILDEVYNDIMGEFESSGNNEMPETLDDIEGAALKFGREFEKRAIEKFLERKHKTTKVKKNV